MDKFFEIGLLLDVYGNMLTKKQQDVMNMRFQQDLSLGEISTVTNTSRQAVNDLIKRSSNSLFEMENKVGAMKRLLQIEQQLEIIADQIETTAKELHVESAFEPVVQAIEQVITIE